MPKRPRRGERRGRQTSWGGFSPELRFSAYVVRSGGYTIPEYPAALPTRCSTGCSKVGPKKKAGKKAKKSAKKSAKKAPKAKAKKKKAKKAKR
jgi:hypothetical protein